MKGIFKNKKRIVGAVLIIILGIFLFNIIQTQFRVRSHVRCEESPEVCEVVVGEPFILLSSRHSGIMLTGCFLGDIKYNEQYLKEVEPITAQSLLGRIFGSKTIYYRYLPRKVGQTTVKTTGTCSYSDRTYKIKIKPSSKEQ